MFWGVRLQNNTGATITSLDFAYTGEQWREQRCRGTDGHVLLPDWGVPRSPVHSRSSSRPASLSRRWISRVRSPAARPAQSMATSAANRVDQDLFDHWAQHPERDRDHASMVRSGSHGSRPRALNRRLLCHATGGKPTAQPEHQRCHLGRGRCPRRHHLHFRRHPYGACRPGRRDVRHRDGRRHGPGRQSFN